MSASPHDEMPCGMSTDIPHPSPDWGWDRCASDGASRGRPCHKHLLVGVSNPCCCSFLFDMDPDLDEQEHAASFRIDGVDEPAAIPAVDELYLHALPHCRSD